MFTDGRGWCLQRTLATFEEHVDQDLITYRVVVNDDAEEPFYQRHVDEVCAHFDRRINALPRRRGFAGAIATGWEAVRELDTDFVFHLEDDFQFERDVDLAAMARVLSEHPHLVQMVLQRQPWSTDETEAGGVLELHPDAFIDKTDGENMWLEHRVFFSTNPCLYHASLLRRGWPTGEHSEGRFSISLFNEDFRRMSGYWGARDSGVWVRHIGAQRIGIEY
jgi:glycosyltransferase involved in cell wall biosynthesis